MVDSNARLLLRFAESAVLAAFHATLSPEI
jgi:hypothetical protein